MSKKSRKRREQRKKSFNTPDDYLFTGEFEMARFGTNVFVKNHRTPSQQKEYMQYLCDEYPKKYKEIDQKLQSIRELITECDPLFVLMYFKSVVAASQINIFSEIEYTSATNTAMRAQEYVQSVLVSTKNKHDSSMSQEEQERLCERILSEFEDVYKKIPLFYNFWGAKVKVSEEISDDLLTNIVESQYMYWVRGNRYQIFELEPIKNLLPPHDSVLQELFGMTSDDIIRGLDKLRYSLSQGYADSWMDLHRSFDKYLAALEAGASESEAHQSVSQQMDGITDKVFGSKLNDVIEVTGWNPSFVDALSYEVGECESFLGDEEFSGWPVVELPIMRKPFIKIGDRSYAFLYYTLFDNIYRNIQKLIFKEKKDYPDVWQEKQCVASEEMVKDLFLKLLPGADAYVGNYYPVRASLKQTNENDILIIYKNYLFIIEVKAGSFPISPPITDFQSHISAYKKLAEVADFQCKRTFDYVKAHTPAKFYDSEKNFKFEVPDLALFDDVFAFSVTVDNFNEFAAKAEKLSFISVSKDTIVISFDDLLVYNGFFDSPIAFLHYLKQRKMAMSIPQFQMFDELDHLGLYIDRNMYALNPSQYRDVKNVFWNGFRKEIDTYFDMLYSCPDKVQKPQQDIPEGIRKIVDFLTTDVTEEKIKLAHFLLDLSTDAKKDFEDQLQYALRRQRQLGRMVPIVAFGEIKYCAFVNTPKITPLSESQQRDYSYAAASRNENIPVMWIALEYDTQNTLVSVRGKKCLLSDLNAKEADRIRHIGFEKAKDWIALYERRHGKVGRNDYCPCGSGKKYKFCCLQNNS